MPPHSRSVRSPRALALGSVFFSAALLLVALSLPTVSFQKFGSELEVYSIWGGIKSLWEDGNWIMAPIVFLFSMIWPVAKLLFLLAIVLGRGSVEWRRKMVERLRILGRWSMLDVFIVGLFVGSIRLGFLADASSRLGIEVFFAAILASMIAVHLVACMEPVSPASTSGEEPLPVDLPELRNWWLRLLSLSSFVLLGAALYYGVVEIKKGFVFKNEVALLLTTWRMAREGEPVLAAGLGLLVIGTSSLRSLLLLRLRWLPGGGEAWRRCTLLVDEWAMVEVGALGLAIVYQKLDELTTATRLVGFWFLIAAATLAVTDVWLLRRALARRRSQTSAVP